MTALGDRVSRPALPRPELGRALLDPRSVAIIGASDDERKTTSRPLRFLRRAGFTGAVRPINPRRETVLGERAWADVASLPEVPDHVFVVADTAHVVDAVRECGEAGVPLVTVLSGGFGESGPAGRDRLAALLDVAAATGVRVLGPNSIGVVNPRNGLMLTANAAFAEPDPPVGPSFVASQSGSVIGALMTRGKARGIGFSGFVSTGSEVDLTLGEICATTLDDPGVLSYTLFLESLENAGPLAAFAVEAAARDKPVTVYKLGRSEAAAALSVSHTGALAGEDDEAQAFFASCGFARVDTLEGLIEADALQRRLGPPRTTRTPRVGVITSTGGGAAIVVDQLETRGVTVQAPSPAVFGRLADLGLDVAENLIVDLTLAGTRHDLVLGALDALCTGGEFDLVVFVIGSSARLNPELAVSAVAESAAGTAVPVAVWALPDALDSLRLLGDAGVPSFRTAEACADAVAATLGRRPVTTTGRTGSGLPPGAPHTLDEARSAELLAGIGVTFPTTTVLRPGDAPPESTRPVVVKALSERLPHKSDAGGVVLGVRGAAEVTAAVETIEANVRAYDPSISLDGVLLQEMVEDTVVEALVGYRVSPSVGPLVVLAAGGVHAELYRDSTLRLAPVDAATAREMIEEVIALGLARGFRGRPPGDLDALVWTIVAVSGLADSHTDVLEAEINPVAVRPCGAGVVALDALVRRANPTTPTPSEGSPWT